MDSEVALEASGGRAVVSVEAPARLHMGFVDLNGSLGRRFGSLGLSLDGITTQVKAARSSGGLSVDGPEARRVERVARTLGEYVGSPPAADIRVTKAIPPHIGLGSGTQMALAVGMALNRLLGWGLTIEEIASVTDRGARSGMGVGAFCEPGFFVDGGKGSGDAPPPIVARAPFPESWRLLLVYDEAGQGLHGKGEKEAFETLLAFPEADAGHLARLILMRILPALKDEDVDAFGMGVGELQAIIGDYFAPAQGGRYTSPKVAEAMGWLQEQGVAGVGQSSWGPTGFAVFGDARQATRYQQALQERFKGVEGLQTQVLAGARSGALIQEHPGSGADAPEPQSATF
ncbi:beta-ribofuranosylaminobenzene 5'-phosphate synthase family protein [Thiohalorhabdus methylotrophus]|uniref:Beta-ribofuranosylaminobenzene 5'-phosphate synthase family protein n=1 Tax=Thiohalorhabdus methylotrophus TaxID=3242694 RepID=A0ABV4TVD1_9GAMM